MNDSPAEDKEVNYVSAPVAPGRGRRWLMPAGVALVVLIAGVATAFVLTRPTPTYCIGVSLPLSGEKATSGRAILNALELYVQDLKARGGIDGTQLELVVKDDANDPARGKRNAEEFAQDPRILAVVGYYDDAVGIPAVEVYDREKLVVFSPWISNAEFNKKSPWAFTGTFSNALQGQTLAAYLKTIRNCNSVIVIHTDDPYGTAVKSTFEGSASRVDLKTQFISYRERAELPKDFIASHLPSLEEDVDAILLISHSVKGAALIKQIRDRGINRFAAAKETVWAKRLNRDFLFGFVPGAVVVVAYIVLQALTAR